MKVAVFGPGGMLGRQVMKALREAGHQPQPIYRPMVELTNKQSVCRNLIDSNAEAVVNCAGVVPVKATNIVDMIHANSVFPHILVSCGLPTVLISTDCVFSGKSNKKYTTNSTPDPMDYYGRSKLLGEVAGACVVRTSFIGCEHGFMAWLIGAGTVAHVTGKRQQVQGYKNALWTGSTSQEVARHLVPMIATDEFKPGLVHLATEQVINKFDLAVKLVELKGMDVEIVPEYNHTVNRALEPSPGHTLADIDTALAEFKCSAAVG